MENSLVPKQLVGSKLDLESNNVFVSLAAAKQFYEIAKLRLMSVNQWDKICNAPAAVFKLMNDRGQEIVGLAKEGDYIRINIPGPGTKVGDGFDWVKVETITEINNENDEILSVTVRPTHHPLKIFSETAHFFKSDATSTFQVKRVGLKVLALIHGRNELPNTATNSLFDKLRNLMVGWFAKLGFSYPQWKCLAEGLVKLN